MRRVVLVLALYACSLTTLGAPIPIYHGVSSVEAFAASELQSFLQRACGTRAQVHDPTVGWWTPAAPTTGFLEALAAARAALQAGDTARTDVADRAAGVLVERPRIIIGTPATFPLVEATLRDLLADVRADSDGYAYGADASGETLYIAGWTPRGALYGVYAYLEEAVGIGFYEDGVRVPRVPKWSMVPPFAGDPPAGASAPRFDYRAQWIWTRYYGADRGHPLNWGYDEWVAHLTWLARRRVNTVMLYPVGYTRLWGDVHRRAFPETLPFDREVWPEVPGFWGATWSAKAGWGRSPEEVTRLMQRVYAFGREKLGMRFEYNFYLGNFEESLQRAYPEGRWIDWTNVPHHAYYGAAGRSPVLAFTDPRAKELNQRFWKTFIDTFGTDHRYWIAYREESAPNPDDPHDPDRGKSLSDAVNAQMAWICELDPEAEFLNWDWHGTMWITPQMINAMNARGVDDPELRAAAEQHARAFMADLDPAITLVSVTPPGAYPLVPPDLTKHYDPHPWVLGSLLGYAMQDLGIGGLHAPVDEFFGTWRRWIAEDAQYGGRLKGVLHWNEIVQVSPLIDHVVLDCGWTGRLPEAWLDADTPDAILDTYFERRYGAIDAPTMRRAVTQFHRLHPSLQPSMRVPQQVLTAPYSPDHALRETIVRDVLGRVVELRARQADNPCYKAEVVDLARAGLHTFTQMRVAAAVSAARSGDVEVVRECREDVHGAMTALADVLATDRRHCLAPAMYRMLREPGANRLLRLVMLEHASGRLFDNYALNDTTEFIRLVTVPAFTVYFDNLERSAADPATYPVDEARQMDEAWLALGRDFMALAPAPHAVVRDPRHPADIVAAWLNTGASKR